jgi:type III pantothenate kinase
MLLTIDVGNTRIKAAVFKEDKLLEKYVFTKNELENQVFFILKQNKNLTKMIVASVGSLDKNAFKVFENDIEIYFVTKESMFPFHNLYKTPSTLGIDRLVLATGAVLSFPKKNRLVIDAGTCVTYDYIDENDNYLGGAISPGIRLRYESLHNYTSKLPLLEKKQPNNQIGNSTEESIHSGVINALIHEMDGFIDYYRSLNANFIIILTGGDAEFLANQLKNTIFAHSNFLLESLNKTFQYNQQ